jgi:hypothetical protein
MAIWMFSIVTTEISLIRDNWNLLPKDGKWYILAIKAIPGTYEFSQITLVRKYST